MWSNTFENALTMKLRTNRRIGRMVNAKSAPTSSRVLAAFPAYTTIILLSHPNTFLDPCPSFDHKSTSIVHKAIEPTTFERNEHATTSRPTRRRPARSPWSSWYRCLLSISRHDEPSTPSRATAVHPATSTAAVSRLAHSGWLDIQSRTQT